MKYAHKLVLVLAVLILGVPALAATVGIVQRWHGTIEADNVLLQHVIGGGQLAVPTPIAGAGCNTPSLPIATGSDLSGKVGITCGGTGTASAPVLTLAFRTAYKNAAVCDLSPANQATALMPVAQMVYTSSASASVLDLQANTTGLAAGTYAWNYVCTDRIP